MRSLETAAQAGVLIVAALAAIIVAEAARSGFPAIRSGELPLWGLKVRPRCLPACMKPHGGLPQLLGCMARAVVAALFSRAPYLECALSTE